MKQQAFKILIAFSLPLFGGIVYYFDPDGRVFNLPGILVVLVGTFVATGLGQSFKMVIGLIRGLPEKLAKQSLLTDVDTVLFVRMADVFRSSNIRMAEQISKQLDNGYLRQGAQLVFDGTPYGDLQRMLSWKVSTQREQDHSEIKVFRIMMAFAPAFGMLGTLYGLIGMMYGLDSESFEHIGESMGFAMLTTVYGLLMSNLVFKPIVTRLELRSKSRLEELYMLSEVLLMLHERCRPNLIRDCLESLIDKKTVEKVESVEQPKLRVVKSVS